MYGQGRVSLALWCRAGLVFSKTWVKNQWWIPAVSTISFAPNSHGDITANEKHWYEVWCEFISDLISDGPHIGKPFPAHFRYQTDIRSTDLISEILYCIHYCIFIFKAYLSNILLAQTSLTKHPDHNHRHPSIFTTPSRSPTINTSTTPDETTKTSATTTPLNEQSATALNSN
jgi:hypothetical protein